MDAQLIANNPQEEALIKIRSLQMQNATSVQRENIKKLEHSMYRHFFTLIDWMYGIGNQQLLEFSDDQIEAIAEVLYRNRKIKIRAIVGGTLGWAFGLLIPVVGWIIIFDIFN